MVENGLNSRDRVLCEGMWELGLSWVVLCDEYDFEGRGCIDECGKDENYEECEELCG